MEVYINGWSRSSGPTHLIKEEIDSDIQEISLDQRFIANNLRIKRLDVERVVLGVGPKNLNLHGNYLVAIQMRKSEILALAVKAFEGTPIEGMLSATLSVYQEIKTSAQNLEKAQFDVKKAQVELQQEKTAHKLTKFKNSLRHPLERDED